MRYASKLRTVETEMVPIRDSVYGPRSNDVGRKTKRGPYIFQIP